MAGSDTAVAVVIHVQRTAASDLVNLGTDVLTYGLRVVQSRDYPGVIQGLYRTDYENHCGV
jgi:hypothetical protein